MVSTVKKNRLIFEFVLIYLLIPIILFFIKSKIAIFLVLISIFILSIFLLNKDQKFKFNNLKTKIHWKLCIILTILFFVTIYIYTFFLDQNLLFKFPLKHFFLWLVVIIFYPFLSVVPQEFIFRVLFFHRYSPLFKNRIDCSIIINTFIFSYSHLVFSNFHAILITTIASPLFAWAYIKRSFATCIILHSIGGQLIFTIGLGKYFF